jgi:hypothetical protein
MYTICLDATNERIGLKLDGFWTAETMRRCGDELLEMIAREKQRRSNISVLSDCLSYPVQGPEVMAGWVRLLGRRSGLITVPYAIVVATTLNKLQVQRALDASNVQVFMQLSTAKEWLSNQARS